MTNLIKALIRLVAIGFFLAGVAAIPFGQWALSGQGLNAVIGWVVYLGSILIPWAIGYWLFEQTSSSTE